MFNKCPKGIFTKISVSGGNLIICSSVGGILIICSSVGVYLE